MNLQIHGTGDYLVYGKKTQIYKPEYCMSHFPFIEENDWIIKPECFLSLEKLQ